MFKTISLCETTLPRQLGTNYRNFLYSLDFYSWYMLVPLLGNSSMHMCNETQKRKKKRKREKKKAIMLFLVIFNYQHLVRMPVWVLILNEKIKATFSLKLPLFWINLHIHLHLKLGISCFSHILHPCPLKSFSIFFILVIKTVLFTIKSLRKTDQGLKLSCS